MNFECCAPGWAWTTSLPVFFNDLLSQVKFKLLYRYIGAFVTYVTWVTCCGQGGKLQGDKYILKRNWKRPNDGGNENQPNDIWGKQGNFNYNGRTLLCEDKENSVENFEKEYLGFKRWHLGRDFLMKEAWPERLYFVCGWGEVLATGSPDGDYVGFDEGQYFLFIGAISNVSIDCCFQWL
jgi:hypothetical protein